MLWALLTRQCGCHEAGTVPDSTTKEKIVKRFAVSTMLAGSIVAGLLGAAGTARADYSDILNSNGSLYGGPRIYVPHVDSAVRNRSVIVRH